MTEAESKRQYMREWRRKRKNLLVDIYEEERGMPKSYKEYLKKAGMKYNFHESWSFKNAHSKDAITE